MAGASAVNQGAILGVDMTIKEWIKSKGWTQAQFAEMLDLGRATVENWCQGVSMPDKRNKKSLEKMGYIFEEK